MNTAEMERMLRSAGVGKSAWSTTLPKLGWEVLREFVVSRGFATSIAYVHAATDAKVDRVACATVVETLAKELVLARANPFVCDYQELYRAVAKESENVFGPSTDIRDASLIVVRDFVDVSRVPDPENAGYLISWLLRAHSNGVGLVLGGAAPLTAADEQFSPSSLFRLMREVVRFPVKGMVNE